ncbi:unnamed protein product [Ilex paraguariensis]|uniref:Pentatricopeptide repeat-containing protein n=1 Tax=Ilex paraguariensis TaxID=185542 RepID=A0ABC8UHA7_9AQUA
MESLFSSRGPYPVSEIGGFYRFEGSIRPALGQKISGLRPVIVMAQPNTRIFHRKLPKNLRYPRRTKFSPDIGVNTFLKKKKKYSPDTDGTDLNPHEVLLKNETPDSLDGSLVVDNHDESDTDDDENAEEELKEVNDMNTVWDSDEIEAISSLFRGRIPQKPGKLSRERPLPLPLPYKLRPLGLPTPKKNARGAFSTTISSRQSFYHQVYKNPSFLVDLAREIRSLPPNQDVSEILNKWDRFLRKGSLSLTIRELGHMDLPDRALQIFCWAQKQPLLFPDDHILASTVEVLARAHELKMPFNLEKFISLASQSVYEAMIKGFIRAGSLKLAWKLVAAAKDGKRMLDLSIYAKLILELGKNPDKHWLVLVLLDELGEREYLNLTQQDCTAIMKVCIKLGKFEIVENLYNWFKQTGCNPSVVMYTTLVHSRYTEKKYREALAVIWEMEASNCLLDLPAYRVVIKLFVALNDLSRTVRYYSKLKEAGFSPTFDIYRDMIKIYVASGRLEKCKEVCKEAEMAGFNLDKQMTLQLLQLER